MYSENRQHDKLTRGESRNAQGAMIPESVDVFQNEGYGPEGAVAGQQTADFTTEVRKTFAPVEQAFREQRGYPTEPDAATKAGLSNDTDTNAVRMYDQLTGGDLNKTGILEKPTNNTGALESYYGKITKEQARQLERGSRDYVKRVLGVDDTADLTPDARKVLEAHRDWLLGKIVR